MYRDRDRLSEERGSALVSHYCLIALLGVRAAGAGVDKFLSD